jgi:hypothetical protein
MDYKKKSQETTKSCKRIQLTQGQFAIVDSEDFEELNKFKWHAKYFKSENIFYASRSDNSFKTVKAILMHRIILKATLHDYVDHVNHDTLDNRKINIRICTNSQNKMNCKLYSNNKSGINGVRWLKHLNKWAGKITVNNKCIHLGVFANKDDAIKARQNAKIKYFGEFAFNKEACL